MHFAEQMALNHHAIDDDFMRTLRAQFTDAQIVELGMMIGQYIGFGRLLMVLDLEDLCVHSRMSWDQWGLMGRGCSCSGLA